MTTPTRDPSEPATQPDSPAGGGGADTTARPAAMTLSQEQLRVGVQLAPLGVARLERYWVTETRTLTVEVACERVRLVFEQLDGQGSTVDDPPATAAAGDETAGTLSPWMVLTEEQPVVTKTLVPVERIRLGTYWVTEQKQITESVQVERVELDTDPAVRVAEGS